MELDKAEIKRDSEGRLMKGSASLNPAGRPKGKTLKEFAREYLMTLSDEEKIEYLSKLPKDIVWRMAEGNPKQDTEVSGDLGLQITFAPTFNGELSDSSQEARENHTL